MKSVESRLTVTFVNGNGNKEQPFGLFYEEGEMLLDVPRLMDFGEDYRAEASFEIPLDSVDGAPRSIIVDYLRLVGEGKRVSEGTSEVVEQIRGKTTYVDSLVWILSDYMENGIPRSKNGVDVTDGRGKINWKRTVQQVTPVHCNGALLFPVIHSTAPRHLEDLISSAFRLCATCAVKIVGWLWEVDDVDLGEFDDEDVEEYERAVRDSLSRTFVDSRRVRLTHMLNILSDRELVSSLLRNNRFLSSDFDGQFELMVREVLSNISLKNLEENYYCRMQYLNNGDAYADAKPLRPDAVLETDDFTVVLDAKFYNTSNLPSASDVLKQIAYAEHIERKVEGSKRCIFNCFILPERVEDGLMRYVTSTTCSWRDMKSSYDTVHVFKVDFMALFDTWRGKRDVREAVRSGIIKECIKHTSKDVLARYLQCGTCELDDDRVETTVARFV